MRLNIGHSTMYAAIRNHHLSTKTFHRHFMFHSQLEKKSCMVFILYLPFSHLSPESLAKHIHFPVFLSQIWSVVLSLGQLQAVKIKDKKLQLIAY